MMLSRIICVLILVVLLPVSALCAKEWEWTAKEYRGEWLVYGITDDVYDYCILGTRISHEPEDILITFGFVVSAWKKSESADMFMRLYSTVNLMDMKNEKARLIIKYKNNKQSLHNIYFSKTTNKDYISDFLNPKKVIPILKTGTEMTLMFNNSVWFKLDMTGTSDALSIDMVECGGAYIKHITPE